MPLFILGFLLLICLLAYSIVRYISSGESDTRPVRERYPHAFPVHNNENKDAASDPDEHDNEPPIDTESYYEEDSLRGDIDYMIRRASEEIAKKTRDLDIKGSIDSIMKRVNRNPDEGSDEGKTIEFPKDKRELEREKRKRGINSD